MNSKSRKGGQLEITTSKCTKASRRALRLKPYPLKVFGSRTTSSLKRYEQQQSLFFQLFPYDIRSLIYTQLVLAVGDVLHIINWAKLDSKVPVSRRAQPCLLPSCLHDPIKRGGFSNSWGNNHVVCNDTAHSSDGKAVPEVNDIRNLFLSCRRL